MEKKYVYETYEAIAKEFDDTRFCRWNSVRNFLDTLNNYSLIADVGCGNGKNMKYKSENKEYIYIGNDTCKNILNLIKNNNFNTLLANGLSLPYRDHCFDATISIAVLHHIYNNNDRILFIKELIRITKKNGKIHFTVWSNDIRKKNMEHIQNNDYFILWKNKYKRYYHLFSKDEIIDLLNNFPNIKYELFYEFENWCITLHLIN